MSIEAIKEKLAAAYNIVGGPDDFADLPRDEKQKAYELWSDAQHYESKPERRLRRGLLKSKFVLRHSQIKAAAKKRGVPEKFSLTHMKKGRAGRKRKMVADYKALQLMGAV